MFSILNVFVGFVIIGISVGLPIKDEEIDELIYRLQDLKHQNLYDGGDDTKKFDTSTNNENSIYSPRSVDSIGGGNLVRNVKGFDAYGPGNWLHLNSIGNGRSTNRKNFEQQQNGGNNNNLFKPYDISSKQHFVRNVDSIGGGNLVRNLDQIGGAHLLKRTIDSIGGANLLKRAVDSLGGGYLLK